VYCTFRDVNEQVSTRENWNKSLKMLMQAEKMTFMGTLVSGFAHDINNPNQLIAVNIPLVSRIWADLVPLLDRHVAEQEELVLGGLSYANVRANMPAILDDIKGASARISGIIRSLTDYGRKDRPAISEEVNLNHVVENALMMLKHKIKASTDRLECKLAHRPGAANCNRQQLEQVIINLLSNALEALPSMKKGVWVSTAAKPGEGWISVTIRDEGVGMTEETLGQTTEPFFTTKGDEGHSGLGLTVAEILVRENGGILRFDSEPGLGTTVTLSLPAAWS